MYQQLLDLVNEQFNIDRLLSDLDNAKTDEEILSAARNIKVLRQQGEWLKLKIAKLYENEKLK
jgi:hypothetical protein